MEEREFQELLKTRTDEAEQIIRSYLPPEEGFQRTVLEAMNYSLLAGGKRLRPLFMGETYRMFGGSGRVAEPFMAAMEMIHTYSLVHDDLPAMDNDMYRRGRETAWKVYGEGMGVLAGDGLLNYAYETALRAFDIVRADDRARQGGSGEPDARGGEDRSGVLTVARALAVLAEKAGVYGMIGGQCADVEAEEKGTAVSEELLLFIHEHKTAALLQASMMIGAILAGASEEEIRAVERCALNVGIAFQIQDDILDVTGDSGELGKSVGSDAQNHKETYVTVKGLDQSIADVEKLSREAVNILSGLPGEHSFLERLILMLIHRRA